MIDIGKLDECWRAEHGPCGPIADSLRTCLPERWVRFHSLPESKRYPESRDEYDELLGRHNRIISDLANPDDRSSSTVTLVVVTCRYSTSGRAVEPDGQLQQHLPQLQLWRIEPPDDPDLDSWTSLWIAEVEWTPGCLNGLLELVADDMERGVMVMPLSTSWVCHPYDGGIDVIAPSTGKRDALAERYRAWLSTLPSGL